MKKEIYNFLLESGFVKQEEFDIFNNNEVEITFMKDDKYLEIYNLKDSEYIFKGIYKSKQDFYKIFELVVCRY